MKKEGSFIVFEGIDASGTSTQVHKLEEKIEELDKYQDVLRTHEPWRDKEIKRKLREDSQVYGDGLQMAELYVNDRTQHTRQVIRPVIETGAMAFCSRYKMSTCAFQWAQGVELYELLSMHQHRSLLTPDLTFFLDVSREVAQKRIRKNRKKFEKFEKNLEFIDKLINNYKVLTQMSEADPRIFGKVIRIDGNQDINKVSKDIYQEFLKYIILKNQKPYKL